MCRGRPGRPGHMQQYQAGRHMMKITLQLAMHCMPSVCPPNFFVHWGAPYACLYIYTLSASPCDHARSKLKMVKTLKWDYPAYGYWLYIYCTSHMCDIVVMRDLSSGLGSNWTSWANYANLHWTRNDLVKEGIQRHCPVTLYIVYVLQVWGVRGKYTVKTKLLF